MKIYISGKITGEENYMEKFQEVEERLKAALIRFLILRVLIL